MRRRVEREGGKNIIGLAGTGGKKNGGARGRPSGPLGEVRKVGGDGARRAPSPFSPTVPITYRFERIKNSFARPTVSTLYIATSLTGHTI